MGRTSLLALTLAVLFTGSSPALAQGTGKPDLAKAKQIADTVCAACHGADGNSAIAANPNLAGQGAEYISRQLQHFKAGIRVNAVMQGMVASLSPEDIVGLGAFYAQQKPKAGTARDPKLVAMGQSLYRGGDAASGWFFDSLIAAGMTLGAIAALGVPLALLWIALAFALGRGHERRAA